MTSVVVEMRQVLGADASRFLEGDAHATIFQGDAWASVLAQGYGHQTHFFVARSGTEVRGVFVVVRQRVWPLGEKWVALPYQFHCGPPIAEDPDIAAALIRAALAAARSANARYLEVRGSRFSDVMQAEGLVRVDTGLLATNIDFRTHTVGMIRKTTRHEVRYASEAGVVVEHVPAVEGMKLYLAMYLRDMRDLGTPQAGRKLFDAMSRHLAGALDIVVARRQGEVLGSMMVLGDQRVAFLRGVAGTMTPTSREHFVGKALTYAGIEAARARGVATFSMGMTWAGDAGLKAYKSGWGGTVEPIDSFVATFKGEAPRPGDYFGGYKLARRLWSKTPLLVAEPVGHRITRWIG